MVDSNLMHKNFLEHLIEYLHTKDIHIVSTEIPPQGLSLSSVVLATTDTGEEFAIKFGPDVKSDATVLKLISERKINIPVPKLYADFLFEEMPVVILERIKYPLLDSLPAREMSRYIPAMLKCLSELHTIKSDTPGPIGESASQKTWKQIMLSFFNGDEFDWNAIANRKSLDKDIVLYSVNKIIKRIESTEFRENEYSLLHCDFNQRNLFINPKSSEISSIIDWEEAIFGDPISDFARVRMFMWHFQMSEDVIQNYYTIMNFTEQEKDLEDLYWLSRVIEYLAWYSEKLDEFTMERIKLHLDYLKKYKW